MSVRFVFGIFCVRSLGISNSALSTCLPGARPDLSPEDNVTTLELAESPPRRYAELIKSDIPGPSSSRSARSATLRSSLPSTMKVSPIGPSTAKPSKGELLALLETLSWKPRSVKWKTLDSVEKDRPALVKVSKLGASSSSPFKFSQCIAKIQLASCCLLLPPALPLHPVQLHFHHFHLTFLHFGLMKSLRIFAFNTNTTPNLLTEVPKTCKTTQNNLETKLLALSGHAHDNWLNSYD